MPAPTNLDLSQFPGLDLRDESGMLGAADLRDVRWTSDGAIASREGSEVFGDANLNGAVVARAVFADGTKRLFNSSSGDDLQIIDGSTGLTITTYLNSAFIIQPLRTWARMSTPTTEAWLGWFIRKDGVLFDSAYQYTVAGGLTSTPSFQHMNALTGALSAITTPKWCQVAAWSGQERLVGGAYQSVPTPASWGTVALDPSMVWFSEPASPFVYKDSSFVRLGVGDGERITTIVPWRDLLFVFKRSRFWVFTGASVAGDGTVRFQRRPIEAGVGSVGHFAACAGPDGVYFVSQRGIFKSTGGEPVCVSDPIAPIFGNAERLPPFYTGPTVDMSKLVLEEARLAVVHDKLYFTFDVTGGNIVSGSQFATFVMDIPSGRWSYWTVPARYIFNHDSRGMDEAHFVGSNTGANDIFRIRPGLVGDAGVPAYPMAPFYLGPFHRLSKDRVTRVRQLKVWGGGSIDAGMAVDFDRTVRSESRVLTASLPGTAREATLYRQNQWRASYGAAYIGFTPADKASEKAWICSRIVADIGRGRHTAMPDADG